MAGACLVSLPVPGSMIASFMSGGMLPSVVSARICTWSTSPMTRASVPGRSLADSSSLEAPSGPWSSWYSTFIHFDQAPVLRRTWMAIWSSASCTPCFQVTPMVA